MNQLLMELLIKLKTGLILSLSSGKIVPRYPFFVLSILQTYEAFMPDNLTITSYGHCYNALIIANLIKSGISSQDNDINACFNFAEKLAFTIYQDTKLNASAEFDFWQFVREYRKKFIISDSILSRLKGPDYGIITSEGRFRTPYIYYYFLGRFLAKKDTGHQEIIDQMCQQSHVSSNYLTLLFIIHHTSDNQIIDDILLRTMCTLDDIKPAKLDSGETDSFREILRAGLPKSILSNKSVEQTRNEERENKNETEIVDIKDEKVETESDEENPGGFDENPINDIYRIMKNNEIMGQILRNKYGSLERSALRDIIETVADSGLRLVKLLLWDKDWVTREAKYLHKKHPTMQIDEIKKLIQFVSFFWTMVNIEKVVKSINVPEIREIVTEVVQHKSTPAYDLIGYFNHLDSGEQLYR